MSRRVKHLRRDEPTLRRMQVVGRALAVIAAGLWLVLLVAPSASASAAKAPTRPKAVARTTTGTASCPVLATCVTIPAKCPPKTTCPEIIVNPSRNLGSDQAVFITAKNFPVGQSIAVFYCAAKNPIGGAKPVQCMVSATPEMLYPRVVLTSSEQGTASISYAIEEDTDDGNTALASEAPGTETTGSFYCDDYGNPCAIDVMDPQLGTTGYNFELEKYNAATVPIEFAKPSSGCPKATFVQVGSEFGLDRVFPIASQYDCVGQQPSIGIDVATDSAGAVTGLAGGATQVAFVDEPNAPDVQAVLKTIKGGYSLIPVGLSATIIGFRAVMAAGSDFYPDNSFKLTPTMVAGLLSDYYESAENADIVSNCPPLYGGTCSLLFFLNYESGFRPPAVFGAYVRSDPTSSTGEVFDWVCQAPKVPVYLGKYKTVDPNVASQVLVTGLQAGGATVTSCPTGDQFPPLRGPYAWGAYSNPDVQVISGLTNFVPPPNLPSTNGTVAGFAPMNWAEANYYGVLPAALQNAAGNFVVPSAQSLDTAVAGAIKNPNGTLSPNYNDTNPAAYPMPDLWYAVVPKVPASTMSQATAIRTMLHDLLNVTGGDQTSVLPTGFVPLPAAMYKAAEADVDKDVALPSPPNKTTTATTLPSSLPPLTTPSGSIQPVGSGPTGPATGTSTPTTTPQTTPTTVAKAPPTTVAFRTTAFAVMGRSDSWMLPTFVSLLAALFLIGPALLLRARRKPTEPTGTS